MLGRWCFLPRVRRSVFARTKNHMALVAQISDYRPAVQQHPLCRGSFNEAAACVAQFNAMLDNANQPFELAIISEDDPFRMALYPRASDKLRKQREQCAPPGSAALVDPCEDRDLAPLNLAQSNALCEIFTQMGFNTHARALWQDVVYDTRADCLDITLHAAVPDKTYYFYAHGLTTAIIDAQKQVLETRLREIPNLTDDGSVGQGWRHGRTHTILEYAQRGLQRLRNAF